MRPSLLDCIDKMQAAWAARRAGGLPEPWLEEAVRLSVPCHYGEGDRIVRHDPDGRRFEVTAAGDVIEEIEPGWPGRTG